MRPASDYVAATGEVSFATVVAAASSGARTFEAAAVVGGLLVSEADVAVLREFGVGVPLLLAGEDGGNVVAVASRRPVPVEAIEAAMAGRGLAWQVAAGEQLTAFVGDAGVLTDDFAPVDQLLTPYG